MHDSSLERPHGRLPDQLRPVEIEIGVLKFAEGSAQIQCGDTRVLAAASVERRVPPFRTDSGLGWLTAEYSMLPRATHTRSAREVSRGRPSGRTAEIQRLIGRALRAAVDMSKFPGMTLTIDCDVLQADGGTRTASITAGYVAMVEALAKVYLSGDIHAWPVLGQVAAVSVGLLQDHPLLDLEYVEDSAAQVDLNIVATGGGHLIEIQGTGEKRSFSREELNGLLDLGLEGIQELCAHQARALAETLAAVDSRSSRGKRGRVASQDEGDVWPAPSSTKS